jgi:hypothetical protein
MALSKDPLVLEDGSTEGLTHFGRKSKKKVARVGNKIVRRKPGENPDKAKLPPIDYDFNSKHILKMHALQRRVSLSALISDILNGWLELATDYDQAIFKETLPRGARAAGVPERWTGYLSSLGFAPAPEPVGNDVPPPPPIIHPTLTPAPVQDEIKPEPFTPSYGFGNAAQAIDLGQSTSVRPDDIERFQPTETHWKPKVD